MAPVLACILLAATAVGGGAVSLVAERQEVPAGLPAVGDSRGHCDCGSLMANLSWCDSSRRGCRKLCCAATEDQGPREELARRGVRSKRKRAGASAQEAWPQDFTPGHHAHRPATGADSTDSGHQRLTRRLRSSKAAARTGGRARRQRKRRDRSEADGKHS
mmetsp:Transcript_42414/g.119981  ORF Transcript_42414/g.119981 Transcript_42414/m.119981 type:complete len:161 (+) Transcript_42414:74-556(+)